jgi:hypothetical protein
VQQVHAVSAVPADNQIKFGGVGLASLGNELVLVFCCFIGNGHVCLALAHVDAGSHRMWDASTAFTSHYVRGGDRRKQHSTRGFRD